MRAGRIVSKILPARLGHLLGRGLVATTLIAMATSAAPVGAQEPSSATGSLTMIDQTSWVAAGQTFALDLGVSTSLSPDQVDLVVTVYTALNNRSSFTQTLEGKSLGSAVILERRPLPEVLDPTGNAHVELPVGDSSQRRYYLRDSGVYPVRVELRETGTTKVIDQLTTHLINQPSSSTTIEPLGVAMVMPVQAPVATDPKQLFAIPGGLETIDAISEAISKRSNTPVALATFPELLERLNESVEADKSALERLATASQGLEVLRSTWTPLASSTYQNELVHEADRQLERGDSALRKHFDTVSESTFLAINPMDTNELVRLRDHGVERLVVPQANLAVQQRDTTLARPFLVSLGRGKGGLLAVQADSEIAGHFQNTDDPVLAAHQLLADLAVIWNDRPAQQREVVVMPPAGWKPSALFLTAFFDGLNTSAVIKPISLDQAFAVQAEGGARQPLTRQMVSFKASGDVPATRIVEARKRLAGFASMVASDNAFLDELERRLLYSESSQFDAPGRAAQLDAFESKLKQQFGAVHMPPERSIQLTARTGEIPVSIQNDAGYPVKLRVELESDKLQFPDGASREVTVDRQNLTVPFAIDARTSGAFPVQVRITSSDGSVVVAESHIVVRSTAASGLGVAISIGAGSFLILWWARSLLQGRRRSHNLSKQPEPAHS